MFSSGVVKMPFSEIAQDWCLDQRWSSSERGDSLPPPTSCHPTPGPLTWSLSRLRTLYFRNHEWTPQSLRGMNQGEKPFCWGRWRQGIEDDPISPQSKVGPIPVGRRAAPPHTPPNPQRSKKPYDQDWFPPGPNLDFQQGTVLQSKAVSADSDKVRLKWFFFFLIEV